MGRRGMVVNAENLTLHFFFSICWHYCVIFSGSEQAKKTAKAKIYGGERLGCMLIRILVLCCCR
jgi:hypothetical protein